MDVTGGTELFEKIEEYSAKKAAEMGMAETIDGKESATDEYFAETYETNNGSHTI